MSWLDKIKTQLTITCGDGAHYTPEWINARKVIDYNVAQFEFPQVVGSLVYRGTPKGTKYNIELFFQGDGNSGPASLNGINFDHLAVSQAFQDSAADNRPWTLQHPFYGQLIVQPISMEIDNSILNISKITGMVIETISQDYPQGSSNPANVINSNAQTAAQKHATAASNKISNNALPPANVTTKSIATLGSQFKGFNDAVSDAVSQATSDYQNYFNLYNQTIASLFDLVTEPVTVFNLMQALILKPAQFTLSIVNRMKDLAYQYASMRDTLSETMSNLDRLLYATNGGSAISAMCMACGNPQPGDFAYSTDTINTAEQILGYYNQYITDLDYIQSINGGNTTSFIPDHDAIIALDELVNYTITNLFNIAVNGQQQRSVVIEADSNWILLTHRFIGLDVQDANLTKMMQWNNAGLSTALIVPRNTKVIYYI